MANVVEGRRLRVVVSRSGAVSRPALALAAVLAIVPALSAADTQIRRGHEFVVNTYTTYIQRRVDSATAPNGDFVIVWESFDSPTYPNEFDIFGQRFDASGARNGGEFHVTNDPFEDDSPSVGVAADGSFVVAWEGYTYAAYGYRIGARRYGPAGAPLGPEFTVNTTPGTYYNSAVAVAADASFVVAWGSYNDYGEGGGGAVRARRFDAAGTPLGDDFLVNTYTTGLQGHASVAGTPDGRFIVAWEDDQRPAVVARQFDAGGTPQGDEIIVTTAGGFDVKVAAASGGSFVVVWSDYTSIGARRYDDTGAALGVPFAVNDDTGTFERQSDVTMMDDGSFVVAWMGGSRFGPVNVFARRFDGSGVPRAPGFKVSDNTGNSDYRNSLTLTGGSDGSFVVAWRNVGDYSSESDIVAQRFAPGTVGCTPAPRSDCKQQTAKRGVFRFSDVANDARDTLTWQWVKGEATAPEEFGDPLSNTAVALCVYDGSGASQPVASAVSPAEGPCVKGVLCWTRLAGGPTIRYYDGAKLSDGLQIILLRTGGVGQARVSVRASGTKLKLPATPLTPPVTVQLQSSDAACFSSTYAGTITTNGGGKFVARPDVGP